MGCRCQTRNGSIVKLFSILRKATICLCTVLHFELFPISQRIMGGISVQVCKKKVFHGFALGDTVWRGETVKHPSSFCETNEKNIREKDLVLPSLRIFACSRGMCEGLWRIWHKKSGGGGVTYWIRNTMAKIKIGFFGDFYVGPLAHTLLPECLQSRSFIAAIATRLVSRPRAPEGPRRRTVERE